MSQSAPSILVVDDDHASLEGMKRLLTFAGYSEVCIMESSSEVPSLLERRDFDVAFLDIEMPELDGLELLSILREQSPHTECLMLTGSADVPRVVRAIRLGAYDYLLKPATADLVITALERALERRHLLRSLAFKSEEAVTGALRNPAAFRELATTDERMIRLMHETELHAASEVPILVTGETGVGKELLARAIHESSRRSDGPFVAVNMLALSPTLFESEFFGHAKGAFTGADRDRQGYLTRARGGTLFLDEIGDLSLEIQGKLLRILQEGEFVAVGKTQPERADVRFVAATNRSITKLVQQGKFRKDLMYRLQFARLHLPPLRERCGDIPVVAAKLMERAGREQKMSEEALSALAAHDWPGNVRELAGVLESAANLADGGEILVSHLRLPKKPRAVSASSSSSAEALSLAEVERRHILSTYERLGRNKTQTAKALDIGLQTLYRKLKAYGLQ